MSLWDEIFVEFVKIVEIVEIVEMSTPAPTNNLLIILLCLLLQSSRHTFQTFIFALANNNDMQYYLRKTITFEH